MTLEDEMALILRDLRSEVFNSRFTDRYGHRDLIDQVLYKYDQKAKEQTK